MVLQIQKRKEKNAEFGNLTISNGKLRKCNNSNTGASPPPANANVSYLLYLFTSRPYVSKYIVNCNNFLRWGAYFAYIEALLDTGDYFINLILLRRDSIHDFKIGLLSFLVSFVRNFDVMYWDFCSYIIKKSRKQQVFLNAFASHTSLGLRERRLFQLRKFMKSVTLRLVWWFF